MANSLYFIFIYIIILSIVLIGSESQVRRDKLIARPKPSGKCIDGDPNYCRCDSRCHLYQDCCAEKMVQDVTLATSTRAFNYDCHRDEYYITGKCPQGFTNTDLVEQCETTEVSQGMSFIIPVYIKDNILFKNAYCAQCHGHQHFNLLQISAIKCLKKRNISSLNEAKELLLRKSCKLEYHQFTNQPFYRRCTPQLISQCKNGASSEEITNCEEDPRWTLTTSISTHYKNAACCKCNFDKNCDFKQETESGIFSLNFGTYDSLFNLYEWCGSECYNAADSISNDTFNKSYLGCPNVEQSNQELVIGIITFIFSIISIVTLAVMIIVYMTMKELRNFGGMMSVILSSIILVSQIVFIVSANITNNTPGCVIFAGIKHFSYLSSFMWMALFALDLLRTFYGNSRSSTKPVRKLIKFTLIGFGVPLFIILICAILDKAASNFVLSPNYGTCECWFNNLEGGVFWFFGPVALILLFNLTACIAAFVYLFKTARETRQVRSQNKDRQSMFLLCVKLTAVFGIFWILQIVSVFISFAPLGMIVGLLNSLQGFIIGICFLFTKKVKKIVRESYTKFSSSFNSNSRTVNVVTKTTNIEPILTEKTISNT